MLPYTTVDRLGFITHPPNGGTQISEPDMDEEVHTYISGKLLEGVEHVEAVEVNDPSRQCVIVPVATEVKKPVDSSYLQTEPTPH